MSARDNGHGQPATDGRARRNRAIAVIAPVLIALGTFGIGYVVASRGNDTQASPTPSAPSGESSSPSSSSPEPSEGPSEEASESVSPVPASDALPDGRYYVYATAVSTSSTGPALTFDLAYFLRGEAANEAAGEHGGEVPVPNDYYIVNDNPTLRTMPLSPDGIVRYVPEGTCCHLKAGDLDAWSAAVNGTDQKDYPNMEHWGWWIRVTDGEIVRIAQQWVP
ncbi:MAG: hypothetical protein ABI572_02000 [Actinomycetota bacterium]